MAQAWPPEGYIPVDSVLDGISIYRPKPVEQQEDTPETVDFTCPQCNATTAYSIQDGGLKCTRCGYYEPPAHEAVGRGAEEFEFKAEVVRQAAHGWGEARKELQCQNCYAVTTLPVGQLTHTCPFCGSSKVIQADAKQDALRPRFLIPFKLEEDDLPALVSTWLGSSWMLPAALQEAKLGLFSAMYLPFWTFDASTHASWRAQVGYTKTRRVRRGGEWKTETYTEWRWQSGNVGRGFDDLLVTGTEHVTQGVLDAINDFDMRELAPYEPKYLAGINAQAYEITLDEAWERGRELIRVAMTQACEDNALSGGGDKVRSMSMNLEFGDESWRYILLPVYLAPYTFQEETYQIVVNAQTGTVGGTRPVSWPKVIGVSALFFLPVLALGIVGLFFPPLLFFAAFGFMAAVGGVIWLVGKARKLANPDTSDINLVEDLARSVKVNI